MTLTNIQNYYQISDRLATSGQPTVAEFKLIAEFGYQSVINLAMSCSTNAIKNEGAIVSDLGLIYVQIPVVWEHPTTKDVESFFKIMDALAEQPVWVHCAKNMRVSCFIYLWQKYRLQLPEAAAKYPMEKIWQPTRVWQTLIEQAEATFGS